MDWPGLASRLWIFFLVSGVITARLAGRVAGVPWSRVPFLDHRDGFVLVRALAAGR